MLQGKHKSFWINTSYLVPRHFLHFEGKENETSLQLCEYQAHPDKQTQSKDVISSCSLSPLKQFLLASEVHSQVLRSTAHKTTSTGVGAERDAC